MILRARVVLPVSRPPIEDGAVWVAGNRILKVAHWRELSPPAGEEIVDLGNTILLPGLVNAHCHLDYTGMAGRLTPTRTFVDWIKTITTEKGGWIYADFAKSWVDGAKMLVRTGTTTVADVEAVPELLPEAWDATPLRVFSFLEMTGVKSRRQPERILGEVTQKIESLTSERCQAGLSPHAPYSTMPDLLRLSAETARRRNWRVVTHVAESKDEFEMFVHGRGEMFDWLGRNGRDMSDCGQGTPVRHVERTGLLSENLLAIHVNYLGNGDAHLLGGRGVSVVHCPRSHDYFGHRRFPREELVAAGVNVCLGTDSLASVKKHRGRPVELSMLAEMRALAANAPDLSPETIVKMATLNGARALGMTGKTGELSDGALADVIAIPFAGKSNDAHDAIVHHADDVAASMIDGVWAMPPSR
jgi:aminodeoxyfutalosine deaminase